jgi:hypothetical protein
MRLFTALSGKYVTDCDPPLKRIPAHRAAVVRRGPSFCMPQTCPKSVRWMWDHKAGRDMDGLRKLEGSSSRSV